MTDPRGPISPPSPEHASLPWRAETLIDDRFQVIRELGHGGMGAVYLVFDRELCRELALKRIHPASVGQQNHEERFRREYRALAAIHHPGVPQVHHSGRAADGAVWFTMEAIRGEPLRSIFDRDRLDPVRALDLAIQLGKILAAAHEAGVIHRDVKPGNIMVEPGDRVRLLDFGICTALPRFLRAAEPRRRTAHVDRWNSGESHFAGSIGYSDPATYDGTPATVRSDIYSLGAIVYEALTGRRLCDPDSLVHRGIDSAELPVELAAFAADLRRATAHNPFERHRTMAEFVQSLEITRGLLARARAAAAPPVRRPTLPLLLGLALGIVLTVVVRDAASPGHLSSAPAPTPTAPEQSPAQPGPSCASAPCPSPGPSPPVFDPAASPSQSLASSPPVFDPAASSSQSLASSPPTPDPAASPAAPGQPAPRVPASDASGGPSPALTRTRRLLNGRVAAIDGCIRKEGRPLRRLGLALDLDPGGKVRAVRLASGEHSGLSRCVAAALSDMSFPPGSASPLTHTFELTAP
ncbi:MAG TPA: serine/threonine-protein kinase [Nannocystis sp.]|jgi:serine/threonine-protein kinase